MQNSPELRSNLTRSQGLSPGSNYSLMEAMLNHIGLQTLRKLLRPRHDPKALEI